MVLDAVASTKPTMTVATAINASTISFQPHGLGLVVLVRGSDHDNVALFVLISFSLNFVFSLSGIPAHETVVSVIQSCTRTPEKGFHPAC